MFNPQEFVDANARWDFEVQGGKLIENETSVQVGDAIVPIHSLITEEYANEPNERLAKKGLQKEGREIDRILDSMDKPDFEKMLNKNELKDILSE